LYPRNRMALLLDLFGLLALACSRRSVPRERRNVGKAAPGLRQAAARDTRRSSQR